METRFAAMREIADAGILTGICFMPILPGVCDDEANLEAVVRTTAENGGRFVLAGGLTLADQQKEFFFQFLRKSCPDLVTRYLSWYPPGSYDAANYPWNRIALRIRELWAQYGIRDRMPRPVIPGDKLAVNKRIVERLADTAYELEIKGEAGHLVWAYHKAAWAVEDLEMDIRLIYSALGVKGLRSIPDMGEQPGRDVEKMLSEFM